MALDTFANLKQAIINHSGRDDLSATIEDFIQLSESEMFNNSTQPLRLRQMEIRSTANTDGTRFLELPPRFLQMRRMLINTSNIKPDLEQKSTTSLVIRPGVGTPSAFTVTSQIEFNIVPDDVYEVEMQFYAQPQVLSDSNTSNVVLASYPQIYLEGALFHLWIFAKEFEFASDSRSLFIEGIKGANESDKLGRFGAAPRAKVRAPAN